MFSIKQNRQTNCTTNLVPKKLFYLLKTYTVWHSDVKWIIMRQQKKPSMPTNIILLKAVLNLKLYFQAEAMDGNECTIFTMFVSNVQHSTKIYIYLYFIFMRLNCLACCWCIYVMHFICQKFNYDHKFLQKAICVVIIIHMKI